MLGNENWGLSFRRRCCLETGWHWSAGSKWLLLHPLGFFFLCLHLLSCLYLNLPVFLPLPFQLPPILLRMRERAPAGVYLLARVNPAQGGTDKFQTGPGATAAGTAVQALWRSLRLACYSRMNDMARRLENLDFARDINFLQFFCILITTNISQSEFTSRSGFAWQPGCNTFNQEIESRNPAYP